MPATGPFQPRAAASDGPVNMALTNPMVCGTTSAAAAPCTVRTVINTAVLGATALHLDARAPFSRIGAVLGVSTQTVARRPSFPLAARGTSTGVDTAPGHVQNGAQPGFDPLTKPQSRLLRDIGMRVLRATAPDDKCL